MEIAVDVSTFYRSNANPPARHSSCFFRGLWKGSPGMKVAITKKWLKWLVVLVLVLGLAAVFGWKHYASTGEEQVASGNGRIEATEIDIDAKLPARIREIKAEEGDFVN